MNYRKKAHVYLNEQLRNAKNTAKCHSELDSESIETLKQVQGDKKGHFATAAH